MPSKSKKQDKEEVKIEESPEIITVDTVEKDSFIAESTKTNPDDSNDFANIVLENKLRKKFII